MNRLDRIRHSAPQAHMDFRELANTETSALVIRLLGEGSERSRAVLQTLHQALDAALHTAEETLAAAADVNPDREISPVVEQLAAAAQAQIDACSARLAAEAQTRIDALQRELETTANERARLTEMRQALHADIAVLRAEVARH